MKTSITMIVLLMIFCCDNAAGEGSNTTTHTEGAELLHNDKDTMYDWTYVDPVEINLDDLPFVEAFRIQHHAKGEGHTFWWRGSQYTTDLYQEEVLGDGQHKWVRNSDDIDDYCRVNTWDECGKCNGTGLITWYIDRDGDGLGDPDTYTLNCNYPSVDGE